MKTPLVIVSWLASSGPLVSTQPQGSPPARRAAREAAAEMIRQRQRPALTKAKHRSYDID